MQYRKAKQNSFAYINMDKRKRIYTVAGIAAAVVIVGVGLWLLLRPAGVYRAIPQSAIAVMETPSWLNTIDKLNTTYTGTEFKRTELAGKLLNNLTLMGNMLAGDKQLTNALNNGNTLVSLHLASADSFDLLFTSKFSGISNDDLLMHLQNLKTVKQVRVRIFKEQQLMDVELRNGKHFTLSNFKGILSFSGTTFLTEASVSALITGESIASESAFNKARRKVEKGGDMKLYLNYKKASVILPVAMSAGSVPLLADVQGFANWGAYSISFTNQDIKLNGVSVMDEQEDNIPEVNLQPVMNAIPDNAAVVSASYINTATLTDASVSYFKEWIGSTKAFVTIEALQADYAEQNMLLLEVRDAAKAEAQLRSLISQSGEGTAPVDTFLKDKIYCLKDGAVLNRVFGNSFTRLSTVWFVIKGNVAVFSNNIDVLMLSLEKVSGGETLGKKENTIKLSTADKQLLYINPQRSAAMLTGIFKEGSSTESFLRQFLSITAKSDMDGKVIRTRASLVAGSSRVSKGLLWKTKLKTVCLYPPQVVMNNTTHEKEIFVQDTSTNIYLLSRSGEVLFTRKLNDSIIGKVYQLDYYNNGDLQYLFNSATRVYVVDRMGNDVGSYPLRLSATATAGLTLVTDTLLAINRYFIPCNNGAIYGYEGNGKPLSGWSPKTGIGSLIGSLTAFKVGRKDYISAYTASGTLHLYDIKGNRLWSTLTNDTVNIPVLIHSGTGQFSFVQAASRELRFINHQGFITITELIDSATFVTAISTTDSAFNYYFSSTNAIRSYNHLHQFQKSTALKSGTIAAMQQISISGNTYLLVTDNNNTLLLYDSNLNAVSEFTAPINGAYCINDLFERNEIITLTCGPMANIICTRIK